MFVFLFFIVVSYLALSYIIDTIDDINIDIHYMLDTHKIKNNVVEILWEVVQVVFCTLIILLVIVILSIAYTILK